MAWKCWLKDFCALYSNQIDPLMKLTDSNIDMNLEQRKSKHIYSDFVLIFLYFKMYLSFNYVYHL